MEVCGESGSSILEKGQNEEILRESRPFCAGFESPLGESTVQEFKKSQSRLLVDRNDPHALI